MTEFLQKAFYGNTAQQWFIVMVIIAGTLVFARIVYWLFSKILHRLNS